MKTNENYTFVISVSTKNYSNKNTINWGAVTYSKEVLSINSFVERIKEGHTFCFCFDDNDDVFNQSVKTLKNFRYTNMIMIDIDDSLININSFVEQLRYKPSISYTTANDFTEKSNYTYRFRLCYLFDEKIKGIEEYSNMYNNILNMISDSIKDFDLKDNCAQSANQQFAGNSNENIILNNSFLIYSISDFVLASKIPFKINIRKRENTLLFLNGKNKDNNKIDIKDNNFINDLNILKQSDLIEKHRTKYEYFTSTKLDYNDKGVAYIPKDYIEIYRSWYKADFQKENGEKKEFTVIKKMKDGDGRRKKLFIAAMIMKKILPAITYEHLLFNLINERYYYYNNSDKQLTNEILSSIASNVVNLPIEDIKLNSKPNNAKFKIDKAYCEGVIGMSANQYKQKVKKQMNDDIIGSNYDCSISLKENLQYFKENNIKIGKQKLYNWCKENNIETNPNKKRNKLMKKNKDIELTASDIKEAIIVNEQCVTDKEKAQENTGKRVINILPPTSDYCVKVNGTNIRLGDLCYVENELFIPILATA